MSTPGSYTWRDRLEENLGPNWQAVLTVGVILVGLLAFSIMTGGCHPDEMAINYISSQGKSNWSMGDIVIAVALGLIAYVSYIKYYKGEKIKLGDYEL